MKRRALAALLVSFVVVACGDDEPPTDAATGASTGGGGGSAAAGQGGTGGTAGEGGASGGEGGASGGEGGSAGGGASGAGGSGPQTPIEWKKCAGSAPSGAVSECAVMQSPLDHAVPDGATTPIAMRRLHHADGAARGGLWLLEGGPGYAGVQSLPQVAKQLYEAVKDLDVYMVDHRGTGASAPLDCPDLVYPDPDVDVAKAVDAAESCVSKLGAEGIDLTRFTVDAAARDLGRAIDRTRVPGEEVYVFGLSYGTRVALRYLDAFPQQPTGVILDGILEEGFDWSHSIERIEQKTKALFDACGKDAFCSGKLGADPWQAFLDLHAKLASGHCPTSANLDGAQYATVFASMATDQSQFMLLPAMVYRAMRCDAADQGVLGKAALRLSNVPPTAIFSAALNRNVLLSELLARPVRSASELSTALDASPVADYTMLRLRAQLDVWPLYDPPPFTGAYASTTAAVLLLAGEFDGRTSTEGAASLAAKLEGANHVSVTFPATNHGVFYSAGACGRSVINAFLKAPTTPVDTSCTETLHLDFNPNVSLFGLNGDAWENP
jgi:pimeloyl-ACP methyl ester carboxylesterase